MEGWPCKVEEEQFKPFYHRKDQLSIDQECLLWEAKCHNSTHAASPNVERVRCDTPWDSENEAIV